ncbi:AMP-binding protein [Lichenifustis flavocetrariae]|uniref:3-methylmercaptopropionyl-CoA ligase n=1 Tax=Lichenifustis flavocetrariae TaxID=2949735 RepID=A0AA42CJR7_9HYPH|nr:AMP-binding protein [Lichenifustis flavocetrariae]MCW6509769.1 AMP-binding protein [Lichenifustis flavocetrariae]
MAVLEDKGGPIGADYLTRRRANHVPLSPLSFLRRAAASHPDRTAIVYGSTRRSWAGTEQRCRRLASALVRLGIEPGDTVSLMAANTPELYEAHFGVPMAGAVLNAINIRLDAGTIGYILDHSDAKVLITDCEFSAVVKSALAALANPPIVIDISDPAAPGERLGAMDYEALLASGDPAFEATGPLDEWDAISLNYTSGTTGRPKGVLYHHRGAYLNAIGNILEWHMVEKPVYLWTLPMFHCNGWCFPWTLAAKAGTNVCLRKVTAKAIYDAIADEGVDHLCGAPIVLKFMVDAKQEDLRAFAHSCKVMTAGAPPPAAVLAAMQGRGFDVTHTYGLTETYGPAVACAWREEWDGLEPESQAAKRSRQGLGYIVCEDVIVADLTTGEVVPADGISMGEIRFRGNVVMKGYFKDPVATEAAFAGGRFRSGDLAVRHPDGYMQIRDRLKDIIICGGENISSIEVEDAICHHPSVFAAAVVALPDQTWGEIPCAVIELAPGATAPTAEEIIAFARQRLAAYKCPKRVIVANLPRTSTGKVQKRMLRESLLGVDGLVGRVA